MIRFIPHQPYIFLLNSLPALGTLFDGKPMPITELKLRQRLQQLEPEDARLLHKVEEILHWESPTLEQTDAAILQHVENLLGDIETPQLRLIVLWRIEIRTLIKAMRLRHRQPSPPEGKWGLGRWTRYIEQHWQTPDFGLSNVYPWLHHANELYVAGESHTLDRYLLSMVWDQMNHFTLGHDFDFIAVVLYVLRWNLKARVSSYDHGQAQQVFEALITEQLNASQDQ